MVKLSPAWSCNFGISDPSTTSEAVTSKSVAWLCARVVLSGLLGSRCASVNRCWGTTKRISELHVSFWSVPLLDGSKGNEKEHRGESPRKKTPTSLTDKTDQLSPCHASHPAADSAVPPFSPCPAWRSPGKEHGPLR